jgi:RNA polymerase sigma-70 factor (ECF subfamily)
VLGSGVIGLLRPDPARLEILGAWFEAEYPRLLRLAYFLTADPTTAEDLVQESFVRIYRAGGRVEQPEFRGYAWRSLVNLSRSTYRKQRRERRALYRAVDAGNAGDLSEAAHHSDVRKALLSLPVKQRACLALRFYEDLKMEDIAQTLGMTQAAVKKQIERGLKALRPVLSDRLDRSVP